ncbi:hypothetical protein MUN88_14175 [Gracilibacillus caseinilyticus]|uniref:Transposase n=1 Tax=Gracilibacillus caseinilyticus TaxID=2932256 RepID=A0ABY4ES11_9BACI|nr:hypothetical protein [Gracilibacillus caseinilyticus]UOQ47214.1 hypothetical protein MUN88_14175 [Gracilibacillus caseinilyticus]
MYLERVKAKGKTYLYLKKYCVREFYERNNKTVYGFGRIEKALKQMYKWQQDYSTFPQELKKEGCTKKDLMTWIDTLETGIHKTGRSFVHQTNSVKSVN